MMAAFAAGGAPLTGAQLQPEIHLLFDHLQGDSPLDFRSMPHFQAETIRRMKAEFFANYRPRPKN